MSNLIVGATFTKLGGQPATGLTLAQIALYLTAVNKATAAQTVIWNGAQNPTLELTSIGQYIARYATADFTTYNYYAMAYYSGVTVLDSVYGYGSVGMEDVPQTGDAYAELIALEATLITLPDFFTVNTGQTGAGAVAGSVVHEIGHAVLAIGTVFPAGAIDFTYTLTDSVTLLPIQGADVWFSTDAGGVNIVWKGVTDAFGVARDVLNNLPQLDAGTYRVWAQRAGYGAASWPDVEVAS